jgi:hypothetical protein
MPLLRHLAVLFAFVAAFAQPAPASAFTPASPETRVGAFEVPAHLLVGDLAAASREQHQGIGAAYDENASDYRFAARSAGGAEKFFIENGVRRSLAVREAGLSEIPATIYRPGQAPVTTTLRLDQLFSPKTSVPVDPRFLRIQPPIHTPIEVQPLGLPGQVPTVPIDQVLLVP